jgi:hypothetical protein
VGERGTGHNTQRNDAMNDETNPLAISEERKSLFPECLAGFIAGIPGIYSALDPAAGTIMAVTGLALGLASQKYQGKTLSELDNRLKTLENSGFANMEYLTSDDYRDLMIDILDKVGKFNTESKRQTISNLYISVVGDCKKYEFSAEKHCIEIVSKITSEQINILKMFKQKKTLHEIDTWEKFYIEYLQFDWCEDPLSMAMLRLQNSQKFDTAIERYAFKYLANQLEIMGCISIGNGLEDYESKNGSIVTADHTPAPIKLTPLGIEFLKHLAD